jgi:hypothetical protein
MAAQKTAVADIYEPDIWNQYFVESTYEKSALIKSGMASPDPELNDLVNSSGGRVFDMPFWDALGHDTGTVDRSKVATDDDTAITPDGATTSKEIAMLDYRTQAWNTANVVKYVAGSDPVAVFMSKYVDWWTREQQRILKKKLDGIFATALASTHVSDVAVEAISGQSAATLIGTGTIQDARFLLGDQYSNLVAMICHSVVYKRLENLNLITVVPSSDQLSAPISYYFGMQVIVDDDMPVVAGSTDGFKYTTYLFANGSVGFENKGLAEGNTDLYYDPRAAQGAGATTLITRQQFVMHPRGLAFDSTAVAGLYPSDAELADGDNWSKVFGNKGIGIVKLVTNG